MFERLLLELPKNSRARALLLTASIVLVFAYAWMGVRLMEPEYRISSHVVKRVLWRGVDGDLANWDEARFHHTIEAEHLANSTAKLESALHQLGMSFSAPPLLIIDGREPHKYSVTENRIDIGSDFVTADGQVEKAVWKSWLLQNAAGAVADSFVRLEVASDFLLLVQSGGEFLSEPLRDQIGFAVGAPIDVPDVRNWLRFVGSFTQACLSAWTSYELSSLCRAETDKNISSHEISELSLRPLLTAILWRAYLDLPLLARQQFMTSWLQRVSSTANLGVQKETGVRSLGAWKRSIRSSLELLWPRDAQSVALLESSEHLAGLDDASALEVDHIVIEAHARETTHSQLGFAVEKSPEGLRLMPQGVTLLASDLDDIRARQVFWVDCKAPQLYELQKVSHQAEQLHFIRECGEPQALRLSVSQSALGRALDMSFAKMNPHVEFVKLNSEALRWSFEHKLVSSQMDLDALMMQRSSPYWGLASAEWRGDVRAFRVKGAVELVDWYRPKN